MEVYRYSRWLRRGHGSAVDHKPGGHVLPQGDEQFACQRDDRAFLVAPAAMADPVPEPVGERRVRLMAQPQPQLRQLDHRPSQPWIARLRDALFTIDRAASPGRRRQARIGGNLAPVFELSEQSFTRQDVD